MKKIRKCLFASVCLFTAFVLWTAAVCCVDVREIGPEGSSVGLAALNASIHGLTGVNWVLYAVTDWLGLVPIAVALGFAALGLVQFVKRKSLRKVDSDILALGAFYLAVMAAYAFFEAVVINYRPTLINERLEASYPSSTTMLAMCVMPTAIVQLNARIKNTVLKRCVILSVIAFTAFMVIGRLLSGVHWFSDIVGGVLFSAGLVAAYHALAVWIESKRTAEFARRKQEASNTKP